MRTSILSHGSDFRIFCGRAGDRALFFRSFCVLSVIIGALSAFAADGETVFETVMLPSVCDDYFIGGVSNGDTIVLDTDFDSITAVTIHLVGEATLGVFYCPSEPDKVQTFEFLSWIYTPNGSIRYYTEGVIRETGPFTKTTEHRPAAFEPWEYAFFMSGQGVYHVTGNVSGSWCDPTYPYSEATVTSAWLTIEGDVATPVEPGSWDAVKALFQDR